MVGLMAETALTAEQERRLAELVAVYPVADQLGQRFAAAGWELYLVGGTVRDSLLGVAQADLDFATNATPAQTSALLSGWADQVWLTGARFGTVSGTKDGYKLEITTYRCEVYARASRHPDVRYAADIETDLSRRDFTVNAMAVRLPDHRFVDPHGGLADLRDRLLRTPRDPHASFGDDPLRMIRLARFAATLGARADEAATTAAAAMAAELDTISRERIRDELSRLVCAPHPGRGMDLLVDTGLAQRFIPEVPALRMQHDPMHQHKDVYAHTMAVVAACPAHDLILRLAALMHDVGKPATRSFEPDGKVTFHHHEVVGARMTRERLTVLRYPNDVIEQVSALVFLHLRFHGYGEQAWTDSAVRRYVHDAGSPEQLQRLNHLTRADVTSRNREKRRRLAAAMDDLESRIERLAEEEELRSIRPTLDGNEIMAHLGVPPGPVVGRARRFLLDVRLDRGEIDKSEAYGLLDDWARQQGLARP
jgi:poly(A) polymerase